MLSAAGPNGAARGDLCCNIFDLASRGVAPPRQDLRLCRAARCHGSYFRRSCLPHSRRDKLPSCARSAASRTYWPIRTTAPATSAERTAIPANQPRHRPTSAVRRFTGHLGLVCPSAGPTHDQPTSPHHPLSRQISNATRNPARCRGIAQGLPSGWQLHAHCIGTRAAFTHSQCPAVGGDDPSSQLQTGVAL